MSTSGGAQVGTRSSVPFTPIARQSSVLSLTLDEFASSFDTGKHFGSMNMDEFLQNVWSAEENQTVGAALSSNNESNPPQPPSSSTAGGLVRQSSLTRRASLTLSRTLSRKTVDEVWRDIQHGQQRVKEQPKGLNYGEMTLEDFLVKAGVVPEDSEDPASTGPSSFLTQFPSPLASQPRFHGASALAPSAQATLEQAIAHHNQIEWHNYNSAMQQQQQKLRQQQEAAIAAYGMPKLGSVITIPGTPSGSGMEGSSDGGLDQGNGLSPAITTPDTPNRGRKRGPNSFPEKTVERRQRRMIKNRESAARSRARKQAYTVELEAEVNQLKEENHRLKKQAEECMKRRRRELLRPVVKAPKFFANHCLNVLHTFGFGIQKPVFFGLVQLLVHIEVLASELLRLEELKVWCQSIVEGKGLLVDDDHTPPFRFELN
ncbi:hypothetical protein R1flu_010376 [Riccia fluitans]|uniref:BZIP domain-containing protein n=1 Tax=Riccia fluitans TaxID=41844 RepID=A0ABD1Z5W6_9MARC